MRPFATLNILLLPFANDLVRELKVRLQIHLLFVQAFPKKFSSWKDMVLIGLPMVLLIVPRITSLSLLLVILRNYSRFYGIIVLVIVVLIILASGSPFYKIDPKRAFIGAVASIFAPCIIVGEHTSYYLVINFSGSIMFLLLTIGMPFMVIFVPLPDVNSNHTDIFNISDYQNQTLQVCI